MSDERTREIGAVYIPPVIMCQTDISLMQKVLWGRIEGLSTKGGYCYASNEWIGEQIGFNKGTVSNNISELVRKGYLHREIIRSESGEIKERRLYPLRPNTTLSTGELTPINGKMDTPIHGKVEESVTDKSVREEKDLLPASRTEIPEKRSEEKTKDPSEQKEEHEAREALRLIGALWNKQPELITHSKGALNSALPNVRARLRDGHSASDLAQAIVNLNAAIADPDNSWTYRGYTLKEFLGRQGGAVMERFLAGNGGFKKKKRNTIHQRGKELIHGFFDNA